MHEQTSVFCGILMRFDYTLYNICDSAVFRALHDQLASLDRHAQLTRCISAAVASLLYKSQCTFSEERQQKHQGV